MDIEDSQAAGSQQMEIEQQMEDVQEENNQESTMISQKETLEHQQPQTVSVSQLQGVDEGRMVGGPPMYEMEFRARQANNRQTYNGEEENVTCGRFPHMDFDPSDVDIRDIALLEVVDGIFMGPFQSGFKTGELIDAGVTHILNVTCKAYTKRDRYFKYLDLHIYDESYENASKYFRLTNRFIG